MSPIPIIRPRAAGFTIVELMFTLFIAAILFAIAVPSFRQMMATSRLVTQTNDFIGAVNYARSEAITRNRSMTLCRADSEATTACSGAAGNWTFWIVRNGAGEVSRRGVVPTYNNTVVVQSTLINDTVVFSSDGLARTNNNTVLVNNHTIDLCSRFSMKENRRTITMGAASRLSTTRTTGTPCP